MQTDGALLCVQDKCTALPALKTPGLWGSLVLSTYIENNKKVS